MHYRRWQRHGSPLATRPTAAERFWSKVDKAGPDGCWVWIASRFEGGYGQFHMEGRNRHAHEVAYIWLVGPVPEGLQLDHLCRNPPCVNPAHLEPVTGRTNLLRGMGQPARNARKTHCIAGHPFDEENTIRFGPEGTWRSCRECGRRKSREHQRARRARDQLARAAAASL